LLDIADSVFHLSRELRFGFGQTKRSIFLRETLQCLTVRVKPTHPETSVVAVDE
jgi:hypothetical protein